MGLTWAGNPEVVGASKNTSENSEAKRVELMNDARERIASLMVDYQQLSADLASLEEKVASGSFLAEDVMAETSKLKVQAQNITNGLTTWTSVLEKFK